MGCTADKRLLVQLITVSCESLVEIPPSVRSFDESRTRHVRSKGKDADRNVGKCAGFPLCWLVWTAPVSSTIWLLTSCPHHTLLRRTDRTGPPASRKKLSVPKFSSTENQFFHIISPIIHPSLSQVASFHPSPLLSFFTTVRSPLPRELLPLVLSDWLSSLSASPILWATLLPLLCSVEERAFDFTNPLNESS